MMLRNVPNADQPPTRCTQRSFQPLYPVCSRLLSHTLHGAWSFQQLQVEDASRAYSRSPLATAPSHIHNCHTPVTTSKDRRTRQLTPTTEIRQISAAHLGNPSHDRKRQPRRPQANPIARKHTPKRPQDYAIAAERTLLERTPVRPLSAPQHAP